MIRGIIGRKLGMVQIFGDDTKAETVTVIEAGPCAVTQVKTVAKEGYNAVQLGFSEAIEVGERVDVSLFKAGDLVDITGVSKGKGFAGVVKRHHFAGGPKTHGQSDRHRHPGSIGAATSPGRVLKGMRMAGHMGDRRTTVSHLEVFEADPARNLLLVKGAVPGGRNGLLLIKKSGKGE